VHAAPLISAGESRRHYCGSHVSIQTLICTMAKYLLQPHVFASIFDDGAVLLDLRSGKYFTLSAQAVCALSNIVVGWPHLRESLPFSSGDSTESTDDLVPALLEKRLLTRDKSCGKSATPIPVRRPTTSLELSEWDTPPSISRTSVCNFLAAAVAADIATRFFPIRYAVTIARRRADARARRCPLDSATLRLHIASYQRLRPLLFTSRDKCLFDSIALLQFLSFYNVFPTWVFGVRHAPFIAHCWLQLDDAVLNDTPEHVSNYLPIMAV
jgi:hypothetical protein